MVRHTIRRILRLPVYKLFRVSRPVANPRVVFTDPMGQIILDVSWYDLQVIYKFGDYNHFGGMETGGGYCLWLDPENGQMKENAALLSPAEVDLKDWPTPWISSRLTAKDKETGQTTSMSSWEWETSTFRARRVCRSPRFGVFSTVILFVTKS